MDESEAVNQESNEVATPIFSVYRRGYDPEQVDRYVADQQRRLDEAVHRASEAERKLAAAVGQLRELHRRVAVYESEQRATQPPALDTLGERVQRILQEAWEGAYNLRQEAEREVTELREQVQREIEAERQRAAEEVEELRQVASREAAELVDEATQRALALRDEMDRRRQAYLERVERDRQRAVSQITYLYDQRQLALSELARLQATVQATIEEMVRSPLGKPVAAIVDAASAQGPAPEDEEDEDEESGGAAAFAAPAAAPASFGAPPLSSDENLDGAGAFQPEPSPFSRIIGDETDLDRASDGEYDRDAPEALTADLTLAVEHDLASTGQDETLYGGVIPEPVRPEEVPTGPMEAVEYGYGRSTPYDGQAELGTEETVGGEPRRPYGGLYDVEADGWA
ncbi:MAG TPA: hypothetical protein VKU92_09225 [Acidimicrobiales bacterium]|nr:hypothetical protein [Acidimicrobiales bacterium]